MSKILKTLSSLSGMQKLVLTEAEEKKVEKTIREQLADAHAAERAALDEVAAANKDIETSKIVKQLSGLGGRIEDLTALELSNDITQDQAEELDSLRAEKEALDAKFAEMAGPRNKASLANAEVRRLERELVDSASEIQRKKARLTPYKAANAAIKYAEETGENPFEVEEEPAYGPKEYKPGLLKFLRHEADRRLDAINSKLNTLLRDAGIANDASIETAEDVNKILAELKPQVEPLETSIAGLKSQLSSLLATKPRTAEISSEITAINIELKGKERKLRAITEVQPYIKIDPETGENNYSREVASLEEFTEADIAAAKSRSAAAEQVSKGVPRSLRGQAQNLRRTNSLVYKEDPGNLEEGPRSFGDMIKIATNKSLEEDIDPETKRAYQAFESRAVGAAGIINSIFSNLKAAPGHVINTNASVKAIIKKIKDSQGRAQFDSDLIKLCWLFLADSYAFNDAIGNPNFVALVTKMESRNSNQITNPISQITSQDDIVPRGNKVKSIFAAIKQKMTPAQIDGLTADISPLINAPAILYSGHNTSKDRNIADTIYYAIINAAGTPEDITRLLMSNGIGSFLRPEALEAIAKQQETSVDRIYGGKALASRGASNTANTAKDETGAPEKNGQPSKGYTKKVEFEKMATLGKKARAQFKTKTSPITKANAGTEQSELDTSKDQAEIEKLTDYYVGLGTNFADPSLQNITISPEETARNLKTGAAVTKEIPVGQALRELFTSSTVSKEAISALLNKHFSTVVAKIRDTKESYEASADSGMSMPKLSSGASVGTGRTFSEKAPRQARIYAEVLNLVTEHFLIFTKYLDKLHPEDLKRLSNIFEVSYSPKEINDYNIVVTRQSEDGNELYSYLEDLLKAISEYNSAGVPSESASAVAGGPTEEELQAVQDLEQQVKVLGDQYFELTKRYEQSGTSSSIATGALEGADKALKTQLGDLSVELNAAKNDLEDAKVAVQRAERAQKSSTANSAKNNSDAWQAEKQEVDRANEALLNLKAIWGAAEVDSAINVEDFYGIVSELPQAVLRRTDLSIKAKADRIFQEELHVDTDISEDMEEWKSEVRGALEKFAAYQTNLDIVGNSDRESGIKELIFPFQQQLEASSDFLEVQADIMTTPEDRKKLNAKNRRDARRSRRSLERRVTKENTAALEAGFEEIAGESADDREKRQQKFLQVADTEKARIDLILKTQAVVPGSALSGKLEMIDKNLLAHRLFKNLAGLEANAAAFHAAITDKVGELKLSRAIKSGEEINVHSEEFIDAMIELVTKFKETLSTNLQASNLETELFLKPAVNSGEVSLTKKAGSLPGEVTDRTTDLSAQAIKDALVNQSGFSNLLKVLDQAQKTHTLDWPTKVITAPVVGMGSSVLGFKSATLLNLMSSIKNFDSIENFDISLNKGNLDALSGLLDISKYPELFRTWPHSAVLMKTFFLMKLQTAVNKAEVIKKFTGDFLGVEVQVEEGKETPASKAVQKALKELNAVFEKSILQTFIADFGPGGTLDSEVERNIQILKDMAKQMGGQIYILQGINATSVVLPEEDDKLRKFILTLGVPNDDRSNDMSLLFRHESNKHSVAFLNILKLLLDGSDAEIATTLDHCISIIKTGLTFKCGYEAEKAIAQDEAYDPTIGKIQGNVEARTDAFKARAEYAGFVEKFKTTQLKDDEGTVVGTETARVDPTQSTQGFLNMSNNFLKAFVNDFSYDAITRALSSVYIDELTNETEEFGARSAQHMEEQKNYNVFVEGVFEKVQGAAPVTPEALQDRIASLESQLAAGEAETEEANKLSELEVAAIQKQLTDDKIELNSLVATIDSDEGKGILKRYKARETSANKRMAETGSTPKVGVPEVTKNAQGLYGLKIKLKRPGGFVNVTKALDSGFKTGIRKGERTRGNKSTPEAGTHSRHAVKQISLLLSDYATGVRDVSTILAAVHSDNDTKVTQLKAYADSVWNSIPKLNTVIGAVSASPYAPGIQEDIVEPNLRGMAALPKPTNIELLTNYDTAIKEAKKQLSKGGAFNAYSEFADFIAKDIIKGKTNTKEVLATLNSVISDVKKRDALISGDIEVKKLEPKDSTDKNKPVIDKKDLAAITMYFFTSVMGDVAAKERLDYVKSHLGTFDISTLKTPAQAASEKKAEEIKSLPGSKVKLEELRADIKANMDKRAASEDTVGLDPERDKAEIAKRQAKYYADYDKLSTIYHNWEAKAKASKDAITAFDEEQKKTPLTLGDIAASEAAQAKRAALVQKAESDKANEAAAYEKVKNLPKSVVADDDLRKKKLALSNLMDEIAAREAKIAKFDEIIEDPASQIMPVPKIINFLEGLYTAAVSKLDNYKNTVGKEKEADAATKKSYEDIKYALELRQLINRIFVVMTFISKLTQESEGSKAGAEIYTKFNNLRQKAMNIGAGASATSGETISDGVSFASLALYSFLELLKEEKTKITKETVGTKGTELKAAEDALKSLKAKIVDPKKIPTKQQQAIRALQAKVNTLNSEYEEMLLQYSLEDRPYMLTIAKHLINAGITKAEELVVNVPRPNMESQTRQAIPSSIEAAVILNLADSKMLQSVRLALNSNYYVSIAAKVGSPAIIQSAYIQVSDLYAIKMFAQRDKAFIEDYIAKHQQG